ncbi:hypothetical protein [Lactococcus lactis]|uniref:hypothetical protein n=1 Tax=Lactococcus lactis TaxID=1358 RepID=UPI00117BD621|nr:hypothetical protein [Lactococcus lactis]TRW70904.1 hypothetical protein FNJ58_04060 [Lactococcus lactis]
MIKFKEFDVGDNNYEEQLEQFQTEHPTAEFVQITGGYTSYEKIWFKYEPSDISDSTDKLSVEKLQEQLNTAKKHIEHVIGTIKHDGHLGTIQTDWILPDL